MTTSTESQSPLPNLFFTGPVELPGEPAEIRRAHRLVEGLIRALGFLHAAAGVLMLPGAIASPLLLPLAAGEIALGVGLRRRRPWARWTASALSLLGLLFAVPAAVQGSLGDIASGTIALAVLRLLNGPNGRTVFSEPYAAVVAATGPFQTSRLTWAVAAGVGVLAAGGALLAALA